MSPTFIISWIKTNRPFTKSSLKLYLIQVSCLIANFIKALLHIKAWMMVEDMFEHISGMFGHPITKQFQFIASVNK